MSSDSIFSSSEGQKKWVLAMEKNFIQQHIFNMPLPIFCVFKVPQILSSANPEAYTPRQFGLGPLHHLRPDLYAKNSQKLVAIAEFLPPVKLRIFHSVIDTLVTLEPIVRACYDQFLDLDIETIAWIIAIDAIYLLAFLKKYPERKQVAGDVLMLENQIPLVLLDKILQVLQFSPQAAYSLYTHFQSFFHDESPLQLKAESESTKYDHLLHQMYSMILNNKEIRRIAFTMPSPEMNECLQFLSDLGMPSAGTVADILTFVNMIPCGRIFDLFKKWGWVSSTSADKIQIPSVSQMTEIVRIKFILTAGGIRDVRFDKVERKFYLPKIRITSTSEVVLRNLMAYEAASRATLEVAEYVDLMCGITDSRKDVEILRKEGIVQGEMKDEEIARIFNGIRKSEKKMTEERSTVEEAVDSVNAIYSSVWRVKVKKMAEKYWCGLIGCWKVMRFVIIIAGVLLSILHSYCLVFGCRQWFRNIKPQP